MTSLGNIEQIAAPVVPGKYEVIPLGRNGMTAIVDADDYDRVMQHQWYSSNQHGCLYAVSHTAGRLHRFVLNLNRGDSSVDHINGDGLDCRKSNLRLATQSQNCANKDRPKGNHYSEYRGVTWHIRSKKWLAQIKVRGKQNYLGLFIDEVEAAKAYDTAAKEAFGEFARTNF